MAGFWEPCVLPRRLGPAVANGNPCLRWEHVRGRVISFCATAGRLDPSSRAGGTRDGGYVR